MNYSRLTLVRMVLFFFFGSPPPLPLLADAFHLLLEGVALPRRNCIPPPSFRVAIWWRFYA